MAQSFSMLTIVKSFEKDFCGFSGFPIYFQKIHDFQFRQLTVSVRQKYSPGAGSKILTSWSWRVQNEHYLNISSIFGTYLYNDGLAALLA